MPDQGKVTTSETHHYLHYPFIRDRSVMLIDFDDGLVDAIIEHRASGQSLSTNPGLEDRILAAIYHGFDAPKPARKDAGRAAYGTGTIGPKYLSSSRTCACGNPADNDYFHRAAPAACTSLYATG